MVKVYGATTLRKYDEAFIERNEGFYFEPLKISHPHIPRRAIKEFVDKIWSDFYSEEDRWLLTDALKSINPYTFFSKHLPSAIRENLMALCRMTSKKEGELAILGDVREVPIVVSVEVTDGVYRTGRKKRQSAQRAHTNLAKLSPIFLWPYSGVLVDDDKGPFLLNKVFVPLYDSFYYGVEKLLTVDMLMREMSAGWGPEGNSLREIRRNIVNSFREKTPLEALALAKGVEAQ